jgi:type IV pilus assembly protein PilM
MEPMYDYDVLRILQPAAQGTRGPNGVSVVRNEYLSAQYGTSSMAQIQAAAATPPRGRPRTAAQNAGPGPTVNAIRIRGFWRENPRSQNIVSDLIKGLRQKSESFRFEISDPANKTKIVDLTDDQYLSRILSIDSVPAKPGDLGMAFEITLPLAREVPFK